MFRLEAITWGLIPAGRDPPGCLVCWAWISSEFFDVAWNFNGPGVVQWCVLILEQHPGD